MVVTKNTLPLKLKADIENAIAEVAKQTADIAYIAMMTDVEIEEENEDEQNV